MASVEIDLTLALQLQAKFNKDKNSPLKARKDLSSEDEDLNPNKRLSVSLVDPSWEYLDPTPDMRSLFITFDNQFFWNRLGGVEVKWSPRMTLCAGVCSYQGRAGLCSIRLSTPLLKLRPRKDLVETLLHEMIHAYLFVTQNNRDRDGHGPEFHKHMYRINYIAGTKISVYHSFNDEVAIYKQHVWQCSGPCRSKPPYYGLVKRSMNRAPSPRDPWWPSHQVHCNGTYVKIQEPEHYGSKKKSSKEISKDTDIRRFFSPTKVKENGDGKNSSLPNKSGNHLNKFDSLKTFRNNSNINGFASTSTGSVNSIGVKNASNSRVHGFSKDKGSNIKAKRNDTKSITTKGGMKKSAGTATKDNTVSNTVAIKKPKFHPETLKEESTDQVRSVFSGTGNTLGSSGSGRSRLLDLYSNNCKTSSNESASNNSKPINLKEDDDECDNCPMCQNIVNPRDFDEHIADCIGDFDYNDPMNDFPSENPAGENVSHADCNDSILLIEHDTYIESKHNDVIILSDDSFIESPKKKFKPKPGKKQLFPCPICNENYSKDRIDQHVNTHFS